MKDVAEEGLDRMLESGIAKRCRISNKQLAFHRLYYYGYFIANTIKGE